MNNKITLHPVGNVRIKENGYVLVIDKPYIPALTELEGFSHAGVFWWAHMLSDPDSRKTLINEKPYKKGPERIGVFATRSPARPNPILFSPVTILEVDQNKGEIRIPYIDAEDGSPVIDIKPYHPSSDRIKNVSVPGWCSHWPDCYENSADFNWESEFAAAR